MSETTNPTLGQKAQQDTRAIARILALLGTSRAQSIGRILAADPDNVDTLLQGVDAIARILATDGEGVYPDGYSVRTPDGDCSVSALRSALVGQDRATLRAVRRLAD